MCATEQRENRPLQCPLAKGDTLRLALLSQLLESMPTERETATDYGRYQMTQLLLRFYKAPNQKEK